MARPQHAQDDVVWLTMREAGARARCSVRTLQRAIARNDLAAGGSPGRRLIRRDFVDAWISGRDGHRT